MFAICFLGDQWAYWYSQASLANGWSTVEKHATRNVTSLSPKKLSTVIIGPWISFRTNLAFLSNNLRLSSRAPKKKHFSLDLYPKFSTKGWLSLVVNHPSRIWFFQRKYDGISQWLVNRKRIWYSIPNLLRVTIPRPPTGPYYHWRQQQSNSWLVDRCKKLINRKKTLGSFFRLPLVVGMVKWMVVKHATTLWHRNRILFYSSPHFKLSKRRKKLIQLVYNLNYLEGLMSNQTETFLPPEFCEWNVFLLLDLIRD